MIPEPFREMLSGAYRGRVVCLTGAAGFIGGHIIDALLELGASIRAIDDLSSSTLMHLSEHMAVTPERLHFVYGSILDDVSLREAVEGSDLIIHLAALGSVPRSVAEPERTVEVNTTGTLRVLQTARREEVRRVVFAGSSSAYGGEGELPSRESGRAAPKSPYAASKLAAEHLVESWSSCYGLEGVNLRYFNIFGPRQRADSAYAAVLASFFTRLVRGQPPVIYGDGGQTRDFTSVDNAVLGTLLAGAVDGRTLDDGGRTFNIGTGHAVSVLQLAEQAAAALGLSGRAEFMPVFKEPREGDVRDSRADISAARSVLGYEPAATLEQGLAATAGWYRAEAEAAV
ncbi:MAG: NAD-dependent epimerase/dehydratase family protein [Planctomycetota bacterium]